MSQKQNFVSNLRQASDQAAQTIRTLRNLNETYTVMALGPGQANEITAEDLAGENLQVTAEQIHAAMAVYNQVLSGLSVEARAAIYALTVNPGM